MKKVEDYESMKNHRSELNLKLMDRSGIIRSSFVRLPNDRGQSPSELVGRIYRQNLFHLLQQTAKRGTVWKNREPKWPEEQISEQLTSHKEIIEFEISPEELQNIEYYITQDIRSEDVEQMPPPLWERVMSNTNHKFTRDRRLVSLLLWLRGEAEKDWDRGSREALLREALLDPQQQRRLKVRSLPPFFPRLIVVGPAPWYDSFQSARAFCDSSLMYASSVVLSSHVIWDRQLSDKFEILPVKELTEFRPLYLNIFENKMINYLTTSQQKILHYLFECAEHMWVRQKEWAHLITGREEDMVRIMNSLSALTSRRLRDKTSEARVTWTSLVLSVQQNSTEDHVVKPLFKYRLDTTTQQVKDEMEKTKKFVGITFLRISEVTRQLPSVGTLMFNPNYKFQKKSSH